ncbi:MAG: CvpA family protein, partial [Oscillospiraceae bacterium]
MDDNTANTAKTGKKRFGPKSSLGKIAFNIIATLIVGAIYFYVTLPALNLQSGDFYAFVGLLCVVYFICALITSGMNLGGGNIKDYFKFVKSQCLPVGILFAALLLVAVVGNIISMPILRAGSYRDLLEVKTGDFATDIEEVSFNEIPMLDGDSAMSLGDRKMGE